MTALEKVRFLLRANKNPVYFEKYFIDISPEDNNWQPGEIEKLKAEYPWLSKFYLDFIFEFDAISIAWVVFYGSDKCPIIPIREEIEYWQEQARGQYLPFAKHPSGGIYIFNKENEVLYFSRDNFDWEDPKFIANNVEEFIDECLLGKRYIEFNDIENDTFYQFLKEQGWA